MMLSEVAIVCIAKNEIKYIEEWIYYHIKIGVSKIIIYDNSDNNELKYLEKTWENKIIVYHYPKLGKIENIKRNSNILFPGTQINAYDNYIVNYKKRNLMYKWVAFIDCDEFIQINNGMNIIDFFNYINFHEGVLNINWVHYGSNGNETYENRPVLERFTKKEVNIHQPFHKTICVINDIKYWGVAGHTPITDKYYRNSSGDKLHQCMYTRPPCIDKITIAHFAVKSKEEFQVKINRGNKHIINFQNRDWNHFNEFDKNEIEDYTLLNILKSPITYYNGLNIDSYLWDHDDLFKTGCISPSSLWWHWDNFGKKEGRITNLNFDYSKYKIEFPNLTNNEIWELYCNKNLPKLKLFDCKKYRNKYADLKHLTDSELITHYHNHGIKEGRILE